MGVTDLVLDATAEEPSPSRPTETPVNATIDQPHPEGTQLRITRTINDDSGFNVREGDLFTVDYFVSAAEAEDGIAFYTGSSNGGVNNVDAPADAVELVRTVEQMNARSIPTLDEVRELVAGLCGERGDKFSIHESDRPGNTQQVELFGQTDDGLHFAIVIDIQSIEQVDP